MKLPLRNTLFWDVDPARFDEQKNRRLIIERVFSLGNIEELKVIFKFYGREIIKKEIVRAGKLDPKTLHFASEILSIPKEDFRCYRRQQSIKESNLTFKKVEKKITTHRKRFLAGEGIS